MKLETKFLFFYLQIFNNKFICLKSIHLTIIFFFFSCLSNNQDTRNRKDYNESHILTAKYAPRVRKHLYDTVIYIAIKAGFWWKAHDPHGKLGLRTGQSQRRDVCWRRDEWPSLFQFYRKTFLRNADSKQPKMSNFHFDLSLKLSQGEVRHFSGEVQKFSGEVRTSPHLPSKSGHDCNRVRDWFLSQYISNGRNSFL